MSGKDPNRYDDIIGLPHFKAHNRRQMSNHDRAAQFAPFAALTGYGESIEEAGRLTEEFIEPGEARKNELDRKFRIIADHISERPELTLEYFVPDLYKEGGEYREETVRVFRIDMYERVLITADKKKIGLDYISGIESPLFESYMNI